jgi:hypothetical protein
MNNPNYAERQGNTYEVKVAQNTRRQGEVQSAEGLAARDGRVASNFMASFTDARNIAERGQYFPAKIADGRSRLADGSDSGNPTWASANDPDIAYDFAYSHGEAVVPARVNVPGLSARSSMQGFTDLRRLDLSSKPRQTYDKIVGINPRRTNEAGVRD